MLRTNFSRRFTGQFQQIGQVRLPMFLEFYRPVIESAEHLIENIVIFTGMPWWFSISVLTLSVRLINVPLLVLQYKAMAPLALAAPDYRLLSDLVVSSTVRKREKLYIFLSSARQINKSHNTRFSKAFTYGFLQLPQFLTFIWGVRSLCVRNPDLKTGGIAWFTDLSAADPYLILPILSIGLTYMNLQRGVTEENKNWLINRFKYYVQMWLIMTLPVTVQWPSVTPT